MFFLLFFKASLGLNYLSYTDYTWLRTRNTTLRKKRIINDIINLKTLLFHTVKMNRPFQSRKVFAAIVTCVLVMIVVYMSQENEILILRAPQRNEKRVLDTDICGES